MGILLLPAQAHGGSGFRNENMNTREHDREDHDGNRGDLHRGRRIFLRGVRSAASRSGWNRKRLLKMGPAYYVNVHTAAYPAGAVRGQLGNLK